MHASTCATPTVMEKRTKKGTRLPTGGDKRNNHQCWIAGLGSLSPRGVKTVVDNEQLGYLCHCAADLQQNAVALLPGTP